MRFQRCEMLFGDNFEKIRNAKILLIGVGGVGGFCLDALWRTGVRDITIVDNDIYDETNQNRQIGAEAVGEIKVYRLADMYSGVKPIHYKVDTQWIIEQDFDSYDLVLDAIDDVAAKVELAIATHKNLISSMGSAKRIDPTKIQYASIWKSHGDALAKKMRDELKKRRFNKNYPVLFSPEPPLVKEKGSFVGVTGAFGLALAAKSIEKILTSTPLFQDFKNFSPKPLDI